MNGGVDVLFDDFFRGFDLDPFFGSDISSYSPKVDVKESDKEIKVLAEQLKVAKGSLAVTEARVQSGQASVLDVQQAKAAALGVEIQLLKLRRKERTERAR